MDVCNRLGIDGSWGGGRGFTSLGHDGRLDDDDDDNNRRRRRIILLLLIG